MSPSNLAAKILVATIISSASFHVANAHSDKQASVDSLFASALDLSRHGRFDESNAVIENILKSFKLKGEKKAAMYGQLGQNAWLAGDYRTCYDILSKNQGRRGLKALEFQKTLSNLPQETICRPADDIRIEYYADSLFYNGKFLGCDIKVPVTIGGKKEMMILDNGCALFSLASESFANKHGIRPIGAEGKASGMVKKVSMWIGIADSLSIGSILFRNVLFTVIPDETLQNPVTTIDAALGANIFRLAGEMQFDNKLRTITFPTAQEPRESNITIDSNGEHYVEALVEGKSIALQLDLGATKTSLSINYYQSNEARIKSSWNEKKSHIGGVGGIKQTIVYSLAELPIYACGGLFTKKDIEVSTEVKPNENRGYGSIGSDFLLSFNKATLNLQKMYLYVEQ